LEHARVAEGGVGAGEEGVELTHGGADALVVVDPEGDGGVFFEDAAAVGEAAWVGFVHEEEVVGVEVGEGCVVGFSCLVRCLVRWHV
jgi:hypothetical protein